LLIELISVQHMAWLHIMLPFLPNASGFSA